MRLPLRLLVLASLFVFGTDVFAQDLLGISNEPEPAPITQTPYDRLMRTLDVREQSFEHRLDRFHAQAQWKRDRLEELHDQLLEEIADYTDQRASLEAVPGSRRPQLLEAVQTRLTETVRRIRRLEEAHDSHLDALLEATTLTRQLRHTVDADSSIVSDADLAQTEEELASINEAIDTQNNRRGELMTTRLQLEEHLTEQRDLLDLARDELLGAELAESERLLARDEAFTSAIELGIASENVARGIAETLADLRHRARRASFRDELGVEVLALPPMAILPGFYRYENLVAGGLRLSSRVSSRLFQLSRSEALEIAVDRSQFVIRHSLAIARGEHRAEGVSEDLQPLEQSLMSATVRLKERECELARERLETINLQLEVVGIQLSALEYRIDLWEEQREGAASRAQGGILNRAQSPFAETYWEKLWTQAQLLIAHPSDAWEAIKERLSASETEPFTLGIVILLLAIGLVTFLITRALLRLLKKMKAESLWGVALLDGLRVALLYIPLSAVLATVIMMNLIPQPTQLLALFFATAPPLINGLLRAVKHLLPKEGFQHLQPQVSRYLRRVIRFTLLTGASLQVFIAIMPLLGFSEDAEQPLWGLGLLTLLAGWVGLLIRKAEVFRLIGADDPKTGTPIGMLQNGIRRTYPIFVIGPIFIVVVFLLGFENLAAVIFRRGLAVLLILMAVPWIHGRLHAGAKRLLAYPGGGGPLALTTENSHTAYRSLAPIITIVVGLGGLGLLAITWDYDGDFFGNLGRAMTYPLFHMGPADITLVSVIAFVFTIVITYVIIKWTLATLRKSFYPLYELTPGMQASIDTLTKYVLFVIGAIIGLQIIGVGIGFLAVFAGIVGIGIGFGSQNLAANFIAGLILQFTKPIEVGDVIEVEGVVGRVLRITTHATIVRTFNNLSVIVPNSSLLGTAVVNWSEGDKRVRLSIDVGVAYGSDVDKVTDLLVEAGGSHKKTRSYPKPNVRFQGFGDSSLDFSLRVWIDDPRDAPKVSSELRYVIYASFEKHQVEIPFPQQDIHFRTQQDVLEIIQKKGWAISKKDDKSADSEDPTNSDDQSR